MNFRYHMTFQKLNSDFYHNSYTNVPISNLTSNTYTAVDKSLHTIAYLWSKMAFFKRVWYKVKVVPRLWSI